MSPDCLSKANSGFLEEERLLQLKMDSFLVYEKEGFSSENYREEEICQYSGEIQGKAVEIQFDCSPYYRLSNGLNIGTSLFLACMNIIFPILLEKDIEKVVLKPLETMISIVNVLADNPFVEESKVLSFESISTTISKKASRGYKKELREVQYSLVKIGKLFKVGFGQVGSLVLNHTMSSDTMVVDFQSNGFKREALFAFWNIKKFDQYVGKYQGTVVPLINKLSELVHGSVFIFDGSTVKNLGDGFFNVWMDGLYSAGTSIDKRMNLADKAVLAVLYFLVQLRHKRNDPQMASIRFGFGLHSGYGIEGMIGSESKIEAGYLSKDVNLSARLQSATSIYGVDLLIDGTVYDYLSVELQETFRRIDKVALKGSATPVTLYGLDALDLDLEESEISRETDVLRYYEKLKKEYRYTIMSLNMGGTEFFLNAKKYKRMCSPDKRDFLVYFNQAVEAYLEGNWLRARELLENCLKIKADNPSKVLLTFIRSHNLEPPSPWEGFRVLESK